MTTRPTHFARPSRHTLWGTVTHLATLLLLAATLSAQEPDFQVYTESPRLLLNARRLRLLKRERERDSLRWAQFDALMTGKARMAEPGFALALWGTITGRADACRQAAEFSSKSTDIRQMALVYDWCQSSLGDAASSLLARRLAPSLKDRPTVPAEVNARLCAAFALADVEDKAAQEYLRYAIETWFKGAIVPKLKAGENPFERRADLYALLEMLHTVRDNLRLDLREHAPAWFAELAPRMVLSYYPQPWPAPENEYRIPAYAGSGEPDLNEAALSRAAELALSSFDANAQPIQFLQGWLMQDRFLMRGSFGIPYEFLWANPYQPGLAYSYMPDLYHGQGQLLVRAGWDESAPWFGYWRNQMQVFENGARSVLKPGVRTKPLELGPVKVFFASSPREARLEQGWTPPPEEGAKVIGEVAFVVGLEPDTLYDVEVDDEGMYDARTDRGGILELHFLPGRKAGVLVRKTVR